MEKIDFLSESEVDKAVEFLRDTADVSAKYRAERIYMEEYRKSLKAMLMKKFVDLPISAQEREARSHEDYIGHLKALKIAVERDEKQRFLRASAEAKIQAWQTKSANLRAIKI